MSVSDDQLRIVPRSDSAAYVSARWCMLPPHIRETIVTIVDAGLREHPAFKYADELASEEAT